MTKKDVEASLLELMDALHDTYGWFTEEEMDNTPRRVANFYNEWVRNQKFKFTMFDSVKYDELIILKNVSVYSLCSHHMLPFYGKAHIAYLPNGKICGVSKLARAARKVASKPQTQEQLTQELADLVKKNACAKFVMVVIECTHLCMLMRGVLEHNSVMKTSAIRYDENEDWQTLKEESLELMR